MVFFDFIKHYNHLRKEIYMENIEIKRINNELYLKLNDLVDFQSIYDKLDEKLLQGISQGIAEGSEDKTRTIVKNMLLRGMSDNDIMALAECNQALVDQVRKSLSVK